MKRLSILVLLALLTTTVRAQTNDAWGWSEDGSGTCYKFDKDGGKMCQDLFDGERYKTESCRGKVSGKNSKCKPNQSTKKGPDMDKKTKIMTTNGVDPFTDPGQLEEFRATKCVEHKTCKPKYTRTRGNYYFWICSDSGSARYENPDSDKLNKLGDACKKQDKPDDPIPPDDDGGGGPPDDGGGGPPEDEHEEYYGV
jgi:hypothetical protein